MTKKILKIIEWIIVVLLILFICVLGYYIISRLTNKGKPTKVFGYYVFEVSSWSMYNEDSEHSLKKGDLIFVKPLKSEAYEVGMVVTYVKEDLEMPVTHMIVEREGNTITTRGINKEGNTTNDAPFDVSKILGEVKGVWKNYEKFISWTTSPIGIICIVLIGFLVVEGLYLLHNSLNNQSKEEESRKE